VSALAEFESFSAFRFKKRDSAPDRIRFWFVFGQKTSGFLRANFLGFGSLFPEKNGGKTHPEQAANGVPQQPPNPGRFLPRKKRARRRASQLKNSGQVSVFFLGRVVQLLGKFLPRCWLFWGRQGPRS